MQSHRGQLNRIAIPLGIGNRIDHVEAMLAASDLAIARGWAERVRFYEDFYALSGRMRSHHFVTRARTWSALSAPLPRAGRLAVVLQTIASARRGPDLEVLLNPVLRGATWEVERSAIDVDKKLAAIALRVADAGVRRVRRHLAGAPRLSRVVGRRAAVARGRARLNRLAAGNGRRLSSTVCGVSRSSCSSRAADRRRSCVATPVWSRMPTRSTRCSRSAAIRTPAIGQGCACTPGGAPRACFSADPSQRNVGVCKDGTQDCPGTGEFSTYAACTGEVLPGAENCTNGLDDNCDGKIDCADPTCATDPACNAGCTDGQTRACYDGPSGTLDVGTCKAGTQTCANGDVAGELSGRDAADHRGVREPAISTATICPGASICSRASRRPRACSSA